jgi:hypothetical protein
VGNHSLDGFTSKVKPYDHQIEALSLAIHSPRVALFLDPGLGKTKIGCDLIQYCRARDPNFMALIIALKVNQFTWKREMEFHSGGDLRLEPLVATSPKTGFKNVGILNDLVSLCSMRRTAEECLDLPERTIQVVPVEAGASLKRLYNTVASHDPITLSGKVVPSPENTITAMGRLAQMSSGFVYLSRKDPNICEACPHLVSCVRDNISPYTTACQVEKQDPGRDVLPVPGSPVMDTVKGLVEEHVNNGKKVILWGKHQYFMEQVSADLTKMLDCEVLRYDSTTESHSEVEAKFNSIEGPVVIVAQISMGIGVTFKAPVMIYGEVSWSLDHWLQSLDRNYGIRAKGFGKLLVQAVVVSGSIAHSTMELLNSKVDVSSMMSTRPNCVTCVNALKCLDEGTMPFDRVCILQDTVEKTKIPVRRL